MHSFVEFLTTGLLVVSMAFLGIVYGGIVGALFLHDGESEVDVLFPEDKIFQESLAFSFAVLIFSTDFECVFYFRMTFSVVIFLCGIIKYFPYR
jgi:hypothetical protein